MNKKVMTVCVIHQKPKVLLGMKKKGFGQGRWNGFGGKQEPGETIDETARREVKEESGLEVMDMKKVGMITFEFTNDPEAKEVHIYRATQFVGKPVESDEMRPQWFDEDKIPYDEMWKSDTFWLPYVLADKRFDGTVLFNEKHEVVRHEIREL